MPEITFDTTKASCHEYPTEWWFPDKGKTSILNSKNAVRICQTCEVRMDCLMYSLPNETHGIWGGMRETEREQERRRRNIHLTPEALGSMSNTTRRASQRLNKERDFV
jgi:WhiB family redox-sensing transcriptional regulator